MVLKIDEDNPVTPKGNPGRLRARLFGHLYQNNVSLGDLSIVVSLPVRPGFDSPTGRRNSFFFFIML